ncbi:MAG: FMN-binding glutamate synthase family protein [Bacteroidota bacterium]
MFWTALAGCLTALLLAALLGLLVFRPLLNLATDRFSRRIFKDPYHENLTEMLNVTAKIGPLDLVELELRAETGKPAERPFGSRTIFSPWNKFFFSSVFLTVRPLPAGFIPEAGTVIGPRAAKPMRLALPIMIAGMAWGNALSARAKIALARGAALAGTATNTGNGPFLPEERAAAGLLIVQVTRALWGRDPDVLRQADALEVQLGQGALGAASIEVKEAHLRIDPDLRAALAPYCCNPRIESTLPEGSRAEDLRGFVAQLREMAGGIPVGVKIGATDRLEAELDLLLAAEPDFIAIDGAEGGTHGVGTALSDTCGLPTLHALCRADRHLRARGCRDRLSLIAAGGFFDPGTILKALALGADAVYLGTAALLAAAHGQTEKATPFEPPTTLLWHDGARARSFDPERGAYYLAGFLRAVRAEMDQILQILGKESYGEVSRGDLCCLDRDLALLAGVRWAGAPPALEKEGDEWKANPVEVTWKG